jgi:hypothetical protein
MMKNTSVLFVWLVWGVGRSLAAEIPADTDADSNSSKLMIHVSFLMNRAASWRAMVAFLLHRKDAGLSISSGKA